MIITPRAIKPVFSEINALRSSYLSHPLNQGLVTHWIMADGAGSTVRDIVKLQHNASITGATWTVSELGVVIDFSGTGQYLTASDHDNLSFTSGGFSIAVWAERDGVGSLVDKYDATSGREYIFGIFSDAVVYGWVFDEDVDGYRGRTSPSVATGVWNHLVMTYSGGVTSSSVKHYNNGVQIDTSDFEAGFYTQMRNTSQGVGIGRGNSGLPSNFDGRIAEVRIYNRELTAGEIVGLYRLRWPGFERIIFPFTAPAVAGVYGLVDSMFVELVDGGLVR